MLYCPGSDMIILSALGVTFTNNRSVFKVNRVIAWPGMNCCFVFCEMFFFFWCWKLCPFLQCSTTNNWHKEFCTRLLSPNPAKVATLGLGTVVAGWSMVCLKMLSDVFGGLVSKVRLRLPCDVCGQVQLERVKFLQCYKCKAMKYCSRVCQKRDWSNHKVLCTPISHLSNKANKTLDPSDSTFISPLTPQQHATEVGLVGKRCTLEGKLNDHSVDVLWDTGA